MLSLLHVQHEATNPATELQVSPGNLQMSRLCCHDNHGYEHWLGLLLLFLLPVCQLCRCECWCHPYHAVTCHQCCKLLLTPALSASWPCRNDDVPASAPTLTDKHSIHQQQQQHQQHEVAHSWVQHSCNESGTACIQHLLFTAMNVCLFITTTQ